MIGEIGSLVSKSSKEVRELVNEKEKDTLFEDILLYLNDRIVLYNYLFFNLFRSKCQFYGWEFTLCHLH